MKASVLAQSDVVKKDSTGSGSTHSAISEICSNNFGSSAPLNAVILSAFSVSFAAAAGRSVRCVRQATKPAVLTIPTVAPTVQLSQLLHNGLDAAVSSCVADFSSCDAAASSVTGGCDDLPCFEEEVVLAECREEEPFPLECSAGVPPLECREAEPFLLEPVE